MVRCPGRTQGPSRAPLGPTEYHRPAGVGQTVVMAATDRAPDAAQPAAPGSHGGGGRRRSLWRTPWPFVVAVVAFFGAVATIVVLAIPSAGGNTSRSAFVEHTLQPTPGASKPPAVVFEVTVDSVDPATGSLKLRVLASPTEATPSQGVTIFNESGGRRGIPVLVVRPNQLDSERSATIPFTAGDVSNYPFDRYQASIQLYAVQGTDTSVGGLEHRTPVPVWIRAESTASGMVVSGSASVQGPSKETPLALSVLDLRVTRTNATQGWVLAMMAIYWAVAILAAVVTILVITGRRPWETRHLAWYSALMFALISFRVAAPNVPPVGTFFDYYAVLDAVGIIALCLVTLMVFYLTQGNKRLRL